jgi:hypothetical protein
MLRLRRAMRAVLVSAGVFATGQTVYADPAEKPDRIEKPATVNEASSSASPDISRWYFMLGFTNAHPKMES